ncbi:MAG: redoxin domain-containing protein [Bacteroidota bacterium]
MQFFSVTLRFSLILAAAVSLLLVGCSQSSSPDNKDTETVQAPVAEDSGIRETPTDYHRIAIKLNGYPTDTVFLGGHYGDQKLLKDTSYVKDGMVVFEGDQPLDGGIYMAVLPPDNRYFEFIVSEDQDFSLTTDTADMIRAMKVEGSLENEVFYENLKFIDTKGRAITAAQEQMKTLQPGSEAFTATQEQLKQLSDEMNQSRVELTQKYPSFLYAKVITTMRDPEVPENPDPKDSTFAYRYTKAHYLDNIDFSDDRILRTPVFHNKIMFYMDRLTYQMPDSLNKSADDILARARANDDVFQYCAITLLNKYAKSKIMGQDAVYVHIVQNVYLTGDAFWSDDEQTKKIIERASALAPTLLNQQAHPITMEDPNGQQQSLYSIQAPYTILYFWDYDCGHCKKVTPKLAEGYPKYQKQGVALYAVSINGDIDTWKEKIKDYGIDIGTNVQDHARATGFDAYYDLRSTPRIFLLDKSKKIVAKQIDVEQLWDLLDRGLKGEL